LGRSKASVLKDDGKLNDGLKRVVRQSAQDEIGKKPEVTIVVSRLS
jgi:ribonuclease J